MLVAVNRFGRLVNTVSDEATPDQAPFACPGCQSQVRLKKGKINRPHFAHATLAQCQFFTENESAEHLNLKGQLYRWARKSQIDQVSLEHCLPELGQIADLMLSGRIALEVQCSPLPVERLRERTKSYHSAGLEVLWLLGRKLWLKDSLTALQRHFLYFSQNRGFHLWELDEQKATLRLKYLIHEDLHGKIQHLTEEFAFEEQNLLDCFRTPFKQQELAHFQGKMDAKIIDYIAQQLYYRNPKWLVKQEKCYAQGDNLLTQSPVDFYPQIQPVKGEYLTQVRQDLSAYYAHFQKYYENLKDKSCQTLYSPVFYERMTRDM
ncbi:competence protein CoiA [Streptococcus merionis]|uniref:competence protein CoiA n=1 Tax=Streptococcus merionis TaxID=400065 RepID=UPI0026EFD472|nr:competence protein CoiA family protein [Streptococcus merionis]